MSTSTIDRAVDQRTYASYARPLLWRLVATREFAVFALLAIVYVYARGSIVGFDGPLTIYFLFLESAPIMLLALPMTLIIITGEIDLSVASTMALTGAMLGIAYTKWDLPFLAAVGVALVVGLLCGLLNGFLVAYVKLPSLAVTVGTLALFRGLAEGFLGTESISGFPDRWTDLLKDRIGGDSSYPLFVIPLVVLAVAFGVLLHFTTFGRGVYEIGLNDEAARFTGVDIARTKLILFMLAGGVAALAGIYQSLYTVARGDSAVNLELQVIAAVLLGGVSIFGGRGSLPGVLAGVLLIAVINSAMRLDGVRGEVTEIVIGCLLVASVIAPTLLTWISGLVPGRAQRPAAAPPAGTTPEPPASGGSSLTS
ncbi:ABC transporter permease [Nocardioides dongxiaopingii]|uniref:ABC transporter permease n=1 Tax=Nocardioides TaxID=1839 RepID=UPI0010C76992|nr:MULTISPECIES: ABC transporter permease [Nocardioides]QCW49645.1 ABC transporter permease [Nocardioides sp. S-1144]